MPYLVGSGEPESERCFGDKLCSGIMQCTSSTCKMKAAQNEAGQQCGWKTSVRNSSKIHLSCGRGAHLWFFSGTTAIKLEYVKLDFETIRKPDNS